MRGGETVELRTFNVEHKITFNQSLSCVLGITKPDVSDWYRDGLTNLIEGSRMQPSQRLEHCTQPRAAPQAEDVEYGSAVPSRVEE